MATIVTASGFEIDVDDAPVAPVAQSFKPEDFVIEISNDQKVVAPIDIDQDPGFQVAMPAVCRPLQGVRMTSGGDSGQGVPMSPRMHRFYRWCDDNGVGLSDWSTDHMVLAVLPKLQQLLELEQATLNALPAGHEWAVAQGELVRDIASIMQRIPANRVQTVQQAQVEEKKSFRQGLIAVSESSDVTGGVVYWQLSSGADRSKLVEALIAQGLEESDAPALATPEVALGRAVKELQGRSVLIRKLKQHGSWAVVRESELNGELDYQQVVRVWLEKDSETIKSQASVGYEAQAQIEVERIVAEYNKARTSLSVIDMSAWLVKLANKLDGVPLRDRGGMYFVPAANIEVVRKVTAALAAAGTGCLVYEIPAMHSSQAVTAIYDAVGADTAKHISDAEAELEAGIGKVAARNRAEEIGLLLKRIHRYEGLLGQQFTGVADKLAKIIERLNKATSRAAQLEID
jgi:hypothetical protein